MTDPKRHPQQPDATGFAPDDPQHPQHKSTQRAMPQLNDSHTERDRLELMAKYPDARPIEIDGMIIARGTRRVADSALSEIGKVKVEVENHATRITALETRPIQVSIAPPPPTFSRAPRGQMQSYSEIEDADVVSGSVLKAAMQKAKGDTSRTTNKQTIAIIGALVALATAGSQWIGSQAERTRVEAERTRVETERLQRETKDAAEAAARAAAEAASKVEQNTPKGTP